MTMSFTATGATKFTPGPYRGRLVSLEEKFKMVTKDDGEKENRPYLRWIFAVEEEGFEGKTLSLLSSKSFGVGPAGPARGRRIVEAIFGRELEIGEKFTDADLFEKPVTLHVDNEKTNRGTFARIVDITSADDLDEAEMKKPLG
jgi:hypothetical protein